MGFTFIDLFAGIGGFRMGLESVGGVCVFSSEIDPLASETYYQNHGERPAGDVWEIDPNEVPDHDVLAGGFPCQPFSISGRHGGMGDERSQLIDALVPIIEVKRPGKILLENVPHIKHISGGAVLSYVVGVLGGLGYTVDLLEVNASDVGIPQNRPRVFFVGSLGEGLTHAPAIDTVCPDLSMKPILQRPTEPNLPDKKYTLLPGKRQESGLVFCGYLEGGIRGKGAVPKNVHHSRTHRMPYRIYDASGIHPCLSAGESSGRYWIRDGEIVRKLTTTEKKRLMGLPDDFWLPDGESAINKLLGNAVVPQVVAKVASGVIG
jgi:DNA (cytosine-5)-methyltransferase 1